MLARPYRAPSPPSVKQYAGQYWQRQQKPIQPLPRAARLIG
jgi:hypothetical protein